MELESFWIRVPGGHPIQASWQEIETYDIWSNVIADSSRLNQSERYANRGCFFKWCLKSYTVPIHDEESPPRIPSSIYSSRISRLHLHE